MKIGFRKSEQVFRLVLVWVLFVCLFAFTTNTALAASSTKETKIVLTKTPSAVERATVNLYCRLKGGRKIFSTSGSGVIISDRGIILTDAHVAQFFLLAGEKGRVTGKCSVRTGSPAKETYSASVLYFPSVWVEQNKSELGEKQPKGTGENDFALLYITGAKNGALPLQFSTLPIALSIDEVSSTSPQEAITITGYPTEKLNFEGVQKKLTMVSASSVITNVRSFGESQSVDILTLAPSAAGGSGVSGGPVVDEKGQVIGIVTSKSTSKFNPTLRAITLSYIDRTLAQSNLSLTTLLASNLAQQASSSPSPKIIQTIASGLLKKK